jgi:hypothetical protein
MLAGFARVIRFGLTLVLALPAGARSIVISEIMATSSSGPLDEDGDSPDWIELRNPGPKDVALDGWFLTDDEGEPAKWRLPSITLPASGQLLVFASGKDRAAPGAPLHANFKLAAIGGTVALRLPDGVTLADRLVYPPQHPGFSYGRGRELDTAPLVGQGAVCRVLAPAADPGAQWRGAEEPFDDRGWLSVTNGVGFHRAGGGATGLLGWWNFDDAKVPSLAPDVSGNNHVCTISGGPAYTADGGGRTSRPGDRALRFSGAGFGRVADAATGMFDSATAHDAISISLWIFGDTTQPQNASVFYGGGNADGSGTRSLNAHAPWGDGVIYWDTAGCCDPGQHRISVAEPDSTKWRGRWNHYAFIKRGNRKEIWQNGRLLFQGVNAARLTPIRSFHIGAFAGSSAYRGLIDDFAVWDVALAEAQIQALASGATPENIDRLDSLITSNVEAEMFGRTASLLLRTPFTGPAVTTADQLVLRVNYDDGFACWLNGAPVAARNAPEEPGYTATATGTRSNPAARQAEEIDLSWAAGLLRPGTNWLVFQGLNASATDNDFLLGFELRSGRSRDGVFFPAPTPGAANEAGVVGLSETPRFTPSGGILPGPAEVGITTETPGAILVYTTNGTLPTLSNGVALLGTTATVPVSGTTVLRAGAFRSGYEPSPVRSATYVFSDQLVRQTRPSSVGSTWPGGYPADFAMDARVINSALPGYGLDEALRDIPSVAIVMSPFDLWGSQTGIYANSTVEMERAGSVEMWFPDGRDCFQVNAGIEIRGSSSSYKTMTPKHSFTIHFRGEYGTPKLRFPVFPDTEVREFNSLVLRGNVLDSWASTESEWNHLVDGELRWYRNRASYVRNQWMNDSLHAQGQPAAFGRLTHLFLNGYYWGIYNLLERLDEHCAASHLGGGPSEYDVVADQELKAGSLDAWNLLMSRAGADLALDANYQRLMGNNADGARNPAYPVLLDVTNLVDYMILHIFAGADDWPWHNWVAFRRRGPESTGFKFLAWDQEISINSLVKQHTDAGQLYAEVDSANSAAYVYSRCRANMEFRQFFADRVQRHLFNGGALSISSNIARFDARVTEIDHAIVAESARWGDSFRPAKPYTREAEWLGTNRWMREVFFPSNHVAALKRFRNARLFPSIAAPVFSVGGGSVPLGFALQVTNPNPSGVIYFTTNGPDPRRRGGGTDTAARICDAAIPISLPTVVRARVLSGITWSPLVETTFYPPQDFTQLAITEIMYDPPPDGLAAGSELEFLELKNTGTALLDLSGLTIGGGITFAFTNGARLAPGAFLLLARNPAAFAARYAGLKADGAYTGKLDNSGDRLTLTDPVGQVIRDFSYDSSPPWPTSPRGLGFSLVPDERTTAEPWQAAHWRASGEPGGSPGADDPTAPADRDGDGLPDAWETSQGTDPLVPDASADPDGDDLTNRDEYAAGTNPRDPADALRLTRAELLKDVDGMALVFSFELRSNRVYTVVTSTNLRADDWTPVRQIPAEPADRRVTITNRVSPSAPALFYRVQVHQFRIGTGGKSE